MFHPQQQKDWYTQIHKFSRVFTYRYRQLFNKKLPTINHNWVMRLKWNNHYGTERKHTKCTNTVFINVFDDNLYSLVSSLLIIRLYEVISQHTPPPSNWCDIFYYDFNVLWSISSRKSVSNEPSIEVIVLQNYFIQKMLRWIGTQVHPLILGKVKYIWILFRVANTMVTWVPSQYKDHLSRYGDSHSKYETVIRPSYPSFLYNGQPYTRKTISLYSDDPWCPSTGS